MRFIILLSATLLVGCTRSESAKDLLEAQGYKDVEITGYAPFSCSEDDTYQTGFTATSPTGRRVSGAVCEGMLFKNRTVRFD